MAIKVMTWNLKFFPAVAGAIALEDDSEYIDASVLGTNEQDLVDADTTKTPLDKGNLIDFARVDKLLEILKTKFPTSESAPDVIFFQEVVSPNYISSIIAKYNSFIAKKENKEIITYTNIVSNINDSAETNQPQKLCIVSKHPIEQVERINVLEYFKTHKRKLTTGPQAQRIHLENFLNPATRPELNNSVGGQPAWGKFLNYFEVNRGIRPIIAAKLVFGSSKIWVTNCHLKSNLPSPKALGIISKDTDTLKLLQAWNKTVREITSAVIASFVESKTEELKATNLPTFGFIIGGDFNTVRNKNKNNPEFEGDASLDYFTSVLEPPMKTISNIYTSYPNPYDQAKDLDIDHIFWRMNNPSGAISLEDTQIEFEIINTLDKENTIEYDTYNLDEVKNYEQGKYYVVGPEYTGNKTGGKSLFLCRKNSSSKGFEAGYINEGALIKSAETTVIVGSNDITNKYVIFSKLSTKVGEDHIGVLLSSCIVILNKGLPNEKTGKLSDLFPGKKLVWSIKRTDISGGTLRTPKGSFIKSDWEQVYPFWEPSIRTRSYYTGYKIVYKEEVWECIELHDPAGFTIEDQQYRNKYWKKLHPIDKSYISDHNALIVTLGV